MARKNLALTVKSTKLSFSQLVASIQRTDRYFSSQANRAVNVGLTLRNWAIGFYIREYEQNGTVSPKLGIPLEKLVTSLSFSHFAELIEIEDPLKRAFYEIETIKGNWSVVPQAVAQPPT